MFMKREVGCHLPLSIPIGAISVISNSARDNLRYFASPYEFYLAPAQARVRNFWFRDPAASPSTENAEMRGRGNSVQQASTKSF